MTAQYQGNPVHRRAPRKVKVSQTVKDKGALRTRTQERGRAGAIVLAMVNVALAIRLRVLEKCDNGGVCLALTVRNTSFRGPSATRVTATAPRAKAKEVDQSHLGEETARVNAKARINQKVHNKSRLRKKDSAGAVNGNELPLEVRQALSRQRWCNDHRKGCSHRGDACPVAHHSEETVK